MRITVIGASGRTGREVVRQALGHGDEVTALVRDASAYEVTHPRLRVVEGDVRDTGRVVAALRDRDAVASVLGSAGGRPVTVYSEGIESILTAMEEADVHRIVVVTSKTGGGLIARLLSQPGMRAVLEDMALMESILMASEEYWTIVRPAALTDGPLTGIYRVVDGPAVPSGKRISRPDLAAFILKALGQGSYVRRAVSIAY